MHVCMLVCVCVCEADKQRPWLLRQVQIDTSFLQTLNVLDYSLLLAHQPLHEDERHPSLSFATFILRAKKWGTYKHTTLSEGLVSDTSATEIMCMKCESKPYCLRIVQLFCQVHCVVNVLDGDLIQFECMCSFTILPKMLEIIHKLRPEQWGFRMKVVSILKENLSEKEMFTPNPIINQLRHTWCLKFARLIIIQCYVMDIDVV